eukprot:351027-Chlamydomonas_euryale.AAC.3
MLLAGTGKRGNVAGGHQSSMPSRLHWGLNRMLDGSVQYQPDTGVRTHVPCGEPYVPYLRKTAVYKGCGGSLVQGQAPSRLHSRRSRCRVLPHITAPHLLSSMFSSCSRSTSSRSTSFSADSSCRVVAAASKRHDGHHGAAHSTAL